MDDRCKKCAAPLPEGAAFCPACGRPVVRQQRPKQRGNGQGCVYELPGGKFKAVVILGYYTDENGKRRRRTRSQVFAKKTDAVKALPKLLEDPRKEVKRSTTFKELYDAWEPTHRAGEDTMGCYHAAIKHFAPVWGLRIADVDVDDLQECLDTCGRGKRTQENMKALAGLMYKYGIPRKIIPDNLNLGPFLIVGGDKAAHRVSFTDDQIKAIKKQIGKTPGAEQVYMLIYLGYRPSEFLDLQVEDYDAKNKCFVAGAKTAAGKGRTVTVSPKIQKYVTAATQGATGALIRDPDGKPYKLRDWTDDVFYKVLEAAGIDNPMVTVGGGVQRHKYTPHSCRHTFSTLMKRVAGSEKDKIELIGHASGEQLRYYQDVSLEDLRAITDAL
jgi:site-specific recombinase XerD